MSKRPYIVNDTPEAQAAFAAEWPPIEERLRKIMPLVDLTGRTVQEDTWVVNVDFSKVAEAYTGAPDTTGMVERFINEVKKKAPKMAVSDLLRRPAGELTRWRKMGNKVTLLPNALVLHVNTKT